MKFIELHQDKNKIMINVDKAICVYESYGETFIDFSSNASNIDDRLQVDESFEEVKRLIK